MTDSMSVWTEGNVIHLPRSYMHLNERMFTQSLILHYPNFQQILRESLRLIVGEEVETRVEIGVAKDGSGVGGKNIYF